MIATDTIRLHLGCGETYREGFVNVDLREDCRTDLNCDVRSLPFDDGDVSEIVAEDLLEHFPARETQALLAEWGRVLHVGGRLTIKCPNMLALSDAILTADRHGDHGAVRMFINNVMGGHRWGPDGAWDTHHWNFTPSTLAAALDQAGFDVESNDLAINMTAVAVKR